MRLTKLIGKTLRQPPSDAHLASHQLLVRAGFVRDLEGGLLAYLPLGHHTLVRLEALVRAELAALGAQEYRTDLPPDVEPAPTLLRIVRREIDSYRQLPVLLFQMASQTMPQHGARAGLFGAGQRPVARIDGFSAAGSPATGQIVTAIENVLSACKLPVTWGEAGPEQGAYFLHQAGDTDVVHCPDCGHAAERPWAQTRWPDPPGEPEHPREEIATPGCNTIASLAEFLNIPHARTLKMVFYSVEGRVTCVVIRGDRAVDETKLARFLGTDQYYASLEHELAAVGAVGGYASPIGLDLNRMQVVADPSVRAGKNFVSGANRADYHIQNVNIPRDFAPRTWVDLALIQAGDPCPQCGAALAVDSAFALARGAFLSCRPEVEVQDEDGRNQPLWVAGYQLDLGRLLAAIVEQHNDEYGILWPVACAPFDVHLVALDTRQEAVAAEAESLYGRLQAEGLAVLYDDREASAGVKFNDADLIGVPLRFTVSKRSAQEGLIEAKWRDSSDRLKLDEAGLAAQLARLGQGA